MTTAPLTARTLPCLIGTAILLALTGPAHAQQVSMQRYDAADGLAHDMVTSLLEDSRGYLWVGTYEGLSRFDGYRFTVYSAADGLGHSIINGLVEDRQGRIWIGTNGGGIARINDGVVSGQARLATYRPGAGGAANVNVLAVDALGRLWCGTDAGVYVADVSGEDPIFTLVGFSDHSTGPAVAHDDRVWVVIHGAGLAEFTGGEMVLHVPSWSATGRIYSLAPAGAGGLIAGTDAGLYRFDGEGWTPLSVELRSGEAVLHLLPDRDGGVWLATNQGLAYLRDGEVQRYPIQRGLTQLTFDSGGNLWAGVSRGGLVQLRAQQILTYRLAEGLPDIDVASLMETRDGEILVVTRLGVMAAMSAAGATPLSARPSPAGHRPLLSGPDHDWWAVTPDGLLHVPGPLPQFNRARRVPVAVRPSLGLPSSLAHLAQDDEGRLWLAGVDSVLYRIGQPASSRPQVDTWPLPPGGAGPLSVLGVDHVGGVWLGNMTSVARFANGQLSMVDPPTDLPELQPRSFLVDATGAVWIGLRLGGVLVWPNPSADTAQYLRYSVEHGLASETVWALAEDREGLIYLGTGRGLVQFHRSSGRIRHLSTADGLASNVINDLAIDRGGTLWVAGAGGVSRLSLPLDVHDQVALPVYVTTVQLAGLDWPLPHLGTSWLRGLVLRPDGRHLRIEFVSPSFGHPERVRYQYRLDAIDADWSVPRLERAVTYAALPPGSYRFQVRATTRGRVSETPAIIEFRIHPVFWRQPWFVALAMASVAVLGSVVQWARRRRRRALDAIRRQVATDLHDDVGSGLVQIAILSEVVKRDVPETSARTLSRIAELARSLRGAMSDIVWAVDPHRDEPIALLERMRQVAFNIFSPSVQVEFHAPDERALLHARLPADRRRHLLLIFKELVTNVSRHAGATRVTIRLTLDRRRLVLTVGDNGAGFEPTGNRPGHGLASVSHRARSLGADLTIDSTAGIGTVVALVMPLRQTRMFVWLPWGVGRG